MSNFYIKRNNGDTTVYDSIRNAYYDYTQYKSNNAMRVIKISFIDCSDTRHSFFNDSLNNLRYTNYFQEIIALREDINSLHNDTVIWFDKPIIFENINQITKTLKIIEVLTDDEFKNKYKIV